MFLILTEWRQVCTIVDKANTTALLYARGGGEGSRFLFFFSTPKERVLFLLDMTYYGIVWFMGLDRDETLLLQVVR